MLLCFAVWSVVGLLLLQTKGMDSKSWDYQKKALR
jgi:hypothetical protein